MNTLDAPRLPLVASCLPLQGLRGSVTQTALLLDEDLSFTEWEKIIGQLNFVDKGCQWWLGDCLNFGERKFGEAYAQVMDSTGLDYQTLANYKWVSGRIPSFLRKEISWTHHREVASMPSAEQAHWLELAEQNAWSVSTLRSKIEMSRNNCLDVPLSALQPSAPAVGIPDESVAEVVSRLQEEPQRVAEILTALSKAARGETVAPALLEQSLAALAGHSRTVRIVMPQDAHEWRVPAIYQNAVQAVLGASYSTIGADGLQRAFTRRVWLCPPAAPGEWLSKLATHLLAGDVIEAIVLTPNDTESGWFQTFASVCTAMALLPAPAADPDGGFASASLGQTILYAGENVPVFVQHFAPLGVCLEVIQ